MKTIKLNPFISPKTRNILIIIFVHYHVTRSISRLIPLMIYVFAHFEIHDNGVCFVIIY